MAGLVPFNKRTKKSLQTLALRTSTTYLMIIFPMTYSLKEPLTHDTFVLMSKIMARIPN